MPAILEDSRRQPSQDEEEMEPTEHPEDTSIEQIALNDVGSSCRRPHLTVSVAVILINKLSLTALADSYR